ncbi:MAG: Lcl domain-containing protein [Sulfuricaulis sp.]
MKPAQNLQGTVMYTQQHQLIAALSLCAAILVPSIASAAPISGQGDWETTLQARYLGSSATPDAYYDTSLNITWLADANAAGGAMDWTSANTWAANLNVNGVTGWSLPTMTDSNADCNATTYVGGPCGFNNPSTSELAHMFYTTLGDKAHYDTSGNPQTVYGLTNTGPFSNVQSSVYWSATEYAPSTSLAWLFSTGYGYQTNGHKANSFYAWAVHAGDVGASAVPVPAAVWLFSSGLMGLVGVARRERSFGSERHAAQDHAPNDFARLLSARRHLHL